MSEQDVLVCQKEIRRLRSVVRELEEDIEKQETTEKILKDITEYAKSTLEESSSSLFGEEDRPNDIYDCGYIDGEYNALVNILNMAGEKHDFQFQGRD